MKRNNEFEFVFLKTNEAAELLRLSPRTLEAMRRNGKGPPFTRLGSGQNAKVVYRVSSIRDWLADKTHDRFVPMSRCRMSSAARNDGERPASEEEDTWIDAFLSHYVKAS
jgi:predicted DNA-binding transcriptional regulator AlpA